MQVDFSFKIKPLMVSLDQSGDLVFVTEKDDYIIFGVIDALGHGAEANNAASLALGFLEENYSQDPAIDITKMHHLLQNSRGVVIGLNCLNKVTGEFTYSGIGNITTRIVGADSKKLVYRDGIVGYSIPSISNTVTKVYPGDIIISYSDGIKENFDLLDFPNIQNESAENISTILMNKYSKNNDDASILTIKVTYD